MNSILAGRKMSMTISPGPDKDKIRALFNSISPVYDFLNRFLSFGLDHVWRKRLIHGIDLQADEKILDAACGTGALSGLLLKRYPDMPFQLTGIDLSPEMLHIASLRIRDIRTQFREGDLEALPFEDETFHHVMVAFGVRNLENLVLGIQEMYRVLKKEGRLYILEFSVPPKGLWHTVFRFYFHNVLPRIGKKVSRHPGAYAYLPDSVDRFPSHNSFEQLLQNCGFTVFDTISMTGGVCRLYRAKKELKGV